MSTAQSAERLGSSSCSTTVRALPRSWRRVGVLISRRLSPGCMALDRRTRPARRPWHLPHVALVLLAGVVRVGLVQPPLEERDDPFVARVVRAVAAVAVGVPDVHLLLGTVQYSLLRGRRQPAPRRVGPETDR